MLNGSSVDNISQVLEISRRGSESSEVRDLKKRKIYSVHHSAEIKKHCSSTAGQSQGPSMAVPQQESSAGKS